MNLAKKGILIFNLANKINRETNELAQVSFIKKNIAGYGGSCLEFQPQGTKRLSVWLAWAMEYPRFIKLA